MYKLITFPEIKHPLHHILVYVYHTENPRGKSSQFGILHMPFNVIQYGTSNVINLPEIKYLVNHCLSHGKSLHYCHFVSISLLYNMEQVNAIDAALFRR